MLRHAEAAIYSIGSLFTSIVPCVILRGVGAALAETASLRCKILLLNGSVDRETGPRATPFRAVDFVAAIARAAEESGGRMCEADRAVWRRYVTHVVYLEGEGVPRVDRVVLAGLGIECVRCWGRRGEDGGMRFDDKGLVGALEAVLGRGEGRSEKSRRNSLEG